jgi:mannose-1-phosphate guanylyltransferase
MPDLTSTCTEALTINDPICLAEARPHHRATHSEGKTWAIVLASGQDARGRAEAHQLDGPYNGLIGSQSLLKQTLERVSTIVPPERTVVVTQAEQDRYLSVDLERCPPVHVLQQPADRGTAAGILLPAHWVGARDPDATVVVFPADHFILEEAVFMRCAAQVAAYVKKHPEWLVLLGVQPTEPEAAYGWIEPGDRVGWTSRGPIYRIRRFRENPSEDAARRLFAMGCLWNSFVFASNVATLIDFGAEHLPLLHDRLMRLPLFFGTQYEAWALRQAYLFAPNADFSRAILESPSARLAVAQVPALTWCDLETPKRLARTLRQLGPTPHWLPTLQPGA